MTIRYTISRENLIKLDFSKVKINVEGDEPKERKQELLIAALKKIAA